MERSLWTVGSVDVMPPLKNEFRKDTPLTDSTIDVSFRADDMSLSEESREQRALEARWAEQRDDFKK